MPDMKNWRDHGRRRQRPILKNLAHTWRQWLGDIENDVFLGRRTPHLLGPHISQIFVRMGGIAAFGEPRLVHMHETSFHEAWAH